jgi:hypothetical protein
VGPYAPSGKKTNVGIGAMFADHERHCGPQRRSRSKRLFACLSTHEKLWRQLPARVLERVTVS